MMLKIGAMNYRIYLIKRIECLGRLYHPTQPTEASLCVVKERTPLAYLAFSTAQNARWQHKDRAQQFEHAIDSDA